MIGRRDFLAAATATSAAAALSTMASSPASAASARDSARTIPVTGKPVPELAGFDRAMIEALLRWNIPGGQCAVAKDGRLVYARGFGYVNDGTSVPQVSPTARFRIASSTKPMTAVTTLRLVERGAIGLEERAFAILKHLQPPPGTSPDARLATITVRQLLEHSGGFAFPGGFDPQFDGLRLAAVPFNHPFPATHTDIVRWAMGQPLGYTPGTRYSYSNFGYNVLGRIIETVTQLAYRDAVQALTFDPIGVTKIKFMTRTSPGARLPDEVFYVDYDTDLPQYSIYSDDLDVRQYSYGGFDGSAIDAHGGAIASAPALTRFLDAVAGTTGVQLLKPATVDEMLAPPNVPGEDPHAYYGLGWDVRPGVTVMGHAGAITFGTFSVIFRLPGGITYAALFNHLDSDFETMGKGIESTLIAVARAVTHWPTHDLYPTVA